MKRYIISAMFAASFSASAARVCTEVPGINGGVVQACKNVPDNPYVPPAAQKPVTTAPTAPAANPPVQPATVAVPETNLGNMPNINQAYSGIAQAASLQTLMPSDGKSTLNLSGATFGGQSAIGLTFAHRSGNLVFSGGVSAGSSGNGLVRVGAGFEF